MTLMKRRKLFDVNTKKIFISIDSQFQRLVSTIFFISSSRFRSIFFVLFFKRASLSFQAPFSSSFEHFLNKNVFTIIELYKKWIVELDIDFSIISLNDQHDCDWWKGWKDNERQFYSKRLKIINYILEQANERFVQAMMKTLKTERVSKRWTLNFLSNRIQEGLK